VITLAPFFYDRLIFPPLRLIGQALLRLYFGLRVERAEAVPDSGAIILVANHASLLDGVVIHGAVWRPLRVLVAAEWAEWGPVRPLFRLIAAIPVARENRANAHAIEAAAEALGRGQALALFPEGALQEDGRLAPFRRGAARLAYRTGAPILPCAIVGAFEAMPWPKVVPRPRRITLRSGRLLRFATRDGGAPSQGELDAATSEVRDAVRRLLEQDP